MVCPVDSSAFAGLEAYGDAVNNTRNLDPYISLAAPLVKGKRHVLISSKGFAAPSLGIAETFSKLEKRGKVALIPYIGTSDPYLLTTAEALKVLDSCGSDISELGVPNSDPLAYGPVIQAAASRYLARGTNFDAITSMQNGLMKHKEPISTRGLAPKASLAAAPNLGVAGCFSNLKKQGKVAFIPYITAGDPDLSTTAEALKLLDSCGSDIIGLGVAYSYPLADDPVIKAAASRSLAKGTNSDAIISLLKEVVPQFTAEKAYIGGSSSAPMDIDISRDPHHLQWNNLFYARCYIKEKLCSVVIDGGSSTNVIAEPLCKYLNLPLARLPIPIPLHGIYGDGGKSITHQTWATFTIGDYVDTHRFLVVPTSSVEVLLGRPWISEMDATHYGRANVYDIKKDGMTIRLDPLTPVGIVELENEIRESRAQY